MDAVSNLFWVGFWITLAMTVFGIVMSILFVGIGCIFGAIGWVFEKLTGKE